MHDLRRWRNPSCLDFKVSYLLEADSGNRTSVHTPGNDIDY